MAVNDQDFLVVMEGLGEAAAFARGDALEGARVHVPPTVDVRAVRTRLGYTQAAFAARFGFALSALREWEQRRREPNPTARVLLTVIAREPEAVRRALEAS